MHPTIKSAYFNITVPTPVVTASLPAQFGGNGLKKIAAAGQFGYYRDILGRTSREKIRCAHAQAFAGMVSHRFAAFAGIGSRSRAVQRSANDVDLADPSSH